MFTISAKGLVSCMPVLFVALLVQEKVMAQETLDIVGFNDIPATVTVKVEAKSAGGSILSTTNVLWTANDNSYTTNQIIIPSDTKMLRFTFTGDCCGCTNEPGCSGASCDPTGNPDCDRNAAIDSFTVFGVTREGENFDRVDSAPSCAQSTVGGRTAVLCGQEGQWAEYDLEFSTVPTVSAWGFFAMILFLGTVGTLVFRRVNAKE